MSKMLVVKLNYNKCLLLPCALAGRLAEVLAEAEVVELENFSGYTDDADKPKIVTKQSTEHIYMAVCDVVYKEEAIPNE